MRAAALALALILLLAGCAPSDPTEPVDWTTEPCEPATGAGQCNLPEHERACVCGWPPFWER